VNNTISQHCEKTGHTRCRSHGHQMCAPPCCRSCRGGSATWRLCPTRHGAAVCRAVNTLNSTEPAKSGHKSTPHPSVESLRSIARNAQAELDQYGASCSHVTSNCWVEAWIEASDTHYTSLESKGSTYFSQAYLDIPDGLVEGNSRYCDPAVFVWESGYHECSTAVFQRA
jgi:hypothetical protein